MGDRFPASSRKTGFSPEVVDVAYRNPENQKSASRKWYGENKELCNLRARKWYEENKELCTLRSRKSKIKAMARNRRVVLEYLVEHPCVDCGLEDVRVLEFDHVRGEKTRSVCQLSFSGVGVARLLAEVEKCDIRCANCHRVKTRSGGWG